MRLFTLWTLLVALSISIVAAYYSIAGLTAIFAAAVIPVIIMGTVLEIAKITTAIWLHLNWKNSPFLMKTYLISATVVLMFITSMGIFGFLSKAHIEQTAVSQESAAQLDQLTNKIFEQEQAITVANSKITELNKKQENTVNDLQKQLAIEQENVDKIVARIQPSIDEKNKIIENIQLANNSRIAELDSEISKLSAELDAYKNERTSLNSINDNSQAVVPTEIIAKKSELSKLKLELTDVDSLLQISTKESIRKLQTLVGVSPVDGINGVNTRTAIQNYRSKLIADISILDEEIKFAEEEKTNSIRKRSEFISSRKPELDGLISQQENALSAIKLEKDKILANTDPRIISIREEIKTIRNTVNTELERSNAHIENLRKNLTDAANISVDESVEIQQAKINVAQNEISNLTTQKFSVESNLRKLEAEVGPVKYIAEVVYGTNADKNMLETAVRWVILLIVFVFDPLAVILLLAGIRMLEPKSNISIGPAPTDPITLPKQKRKYHKKPKPEQPNSELDGDIENDVNKDTQLELENVQKSSIHAPILIQKKGKSNK